MDADRLADLLLVWEERLEQGEDVPAEELCRDSPELAAPLHERIRARIPPLVEDRPLGTDVERLAGALDELVAGSGYPG